MTRKEKALVAKASLDFTAELVEGRLKASGMFGREPDENGKMLVAEIAACLRGHADQAHYEICETGRYQGVDRHLSKEGRVQ